MGERDEEQAWIEQSRNGDPAAFEFLVRRYQRMIHALTYRMTGSLEEAEDLAQETFLRAFQQLERFRADGKFSSWLYRIGVNQCLNWRRRERRRENLGREWSAPDAEVAGTGPEEARVAQVQAALLRLPRKQRAAIVLTVYDGMKHAEAARVLGCSETTVSWRLFAARAKLKRWLGSHCP